MLPDVEMHFGIKDKAGKIIKFFTAEENPWKEVLPAGSNIKYLKPGETYTDASGQSQKHGKTDGFTH